MDESRPKVPHWFALDEQRKHFAFAGIWRPWTGERKGETGEHRLFAFLNEPGSGHQVKGELYSIDAERLGRIDALEAIGQPGNFREIIEVLTEADSRTVRAVTYFKSRGLAHPVHSEYLAHYQLDERFRPPTSLDPNRLRF